MGAGHRMYPEPIDTNQKIAVVGATGFIGSAVFRLLSNRNKNVHPFSRNSPLDFENLDLLRQFTHVIWCATGVNPQISATNQRANEIELEYWVRFLQMASQLSKFGRQLRVVFLSSGGCVYPEGSPPFDETVSGEPLNNYGKLKKEMEEMAIQSDIDLKILRLANVYGPGQKVGVGQGVIAEWVYRILRDLPIEIYGSLDSGRDFVFVDDAARAICQVLDSGGSRIFNIGGGKSVELETILKYICEIADKQPNLQFTKKRSVDRTNYWLNSELANTELHWHPQVSLHQGIGLAISYEMLSLNLQ